MYFNRDMCIHSGICVTNLPEVFDTSRRPWILPDNADDKRLMEVIDRCPSKALKYILKE